MKLIKPLLFLLILLMASSPGFAQKNKKAAKKQSAEMTQALEAVTNDQLKDLLWVLMDMNELEPKAEVLRLFDQLPAEKKEMAMYYTSILKDQKAKGNNDTAIDPPVVKKGSPTTKATPPPPPPPPSVERKHPAMKKKEVDPHAGHNHPPGAHNHPPAKTPAVPVGPTTIMAFAETEFDFGTIVSGDKISYSFSFKNEGKEPLIIINAKGSCGCTVPKWPKEPIAVGATGEITVVFDSKNKRGMRNQKVTITANTDPPQTFLYLKGEVVTGDE